jgi:hypothetical protein
MGRQPSVGPSSMGRRPSVDPSSMGDRYGRGRSSTIGMSSMTDPYRERSRSRSQSLGYEDLTRPRPQSTDSYTSIGSDSSGRRSRSSGRLGMGDLSLGSSRSQSVGGLGRSSSVSGLGRGPPGLGWGGPQGRPLTSSRTGSTGLGDYLGTGTSGLGRGRAPSIASSSGLGQALSTGPRPPRSALTQQLAANRGQVPMRQMMPQANGPIRPSESYIFPFHLSIILPFYVVFFTWRLVLTLAFLFRIDRLNALNQVMTDSYRDSVADAQYRMASSGTIPSGFGTTGPFNRLGTQRPNPGYIPGTNAPGQDRYASDMFREQENRDNYHESMRRMGL